MAAVAIGSKAVGSIVKIKMDGVLREFIVAHQGLPSSMYDSSCNGTWVLQKDCYEQKEWNGSNVNGGNSELISSYPNDYANSTIHSYLNYEFINLIDANIRAQIKQVKIPYRPGSGTSKTVNSGANGLSCKVFLLSGYETGWAGATIVDSPVDGAKLSFFENGIGTSACNKRIANYNGSATGWWLRSPYTGDAKHAWFVGSAGNFGGVGYCHVPYSIRPAFILPSTLMVSDNGTVTTNTAPSIPSTITLPDNIHGGKNITISWGASTDAENNLEGYIVERSVNSGTTWTQIYQGSGRSTTNTVPFGTQTVMYRVKAYDSDGESSAYRTSAAITVINNVSPGAPASITVPQLVQGGGTLAVSWGEATDSDGNLSGYNLERQVDSGEWTEIYSGPELTYTDSITKGWLTVAYRVRALDDQGAYGDYTTSEVREVNNNTPPEITCEFSGDLGEKSADFSVSYTVSDEEGDSVTVTESLDGTQLRTFAYEDGPETCQVAGENFMKLSNGSHKLTISATDGKGISTYELTFTKLVTAASVTLIEPMEADAEISVCVLSVNGEIPEDADFRVEATNNGLDDEPVWEDCTMAVRTGMNHVFENNTVANGFAFNFRLHVERGESGAGGFITSVQGGFQ